MRQKLIGCFMLKKISAGAILAMAIMAVGLYYWASQTYITQRSGSASLPLLTENAEVRYDQWGVPHITANSENDLYQALGYVHAKDRLFQMELMRRLSQGRLAEIFGEKLLETDQLFRTLGIHQYAKEYVQKQDKSTAAWAAIEAYIAGVNAYVAQNPHLLESDLLGFKIQPFTAEDSISVSGYLAYSFAMGMKSEPIYEFMAQELGPEYLALFDLDWTATSKQAYLNKKTFKSLVKLAMVSNMPDGFMQYEGSNAWAISGERTQSGKPILASDPHIAFSIPGAWYEAHLKTEKFELYGHHQVLVPVALMGHNQHLGWGVTMFQNDDMDFYLEEINPENPQQVKYKGQWQPLKTRDEIINVKGAESVLLTVRETAHGPIINDVFKGNGEQPVSLWWAFTQTPNPLISAFYEMNHATDINAFEQGVAKIHSPGLNIMYADTAGNIAWWAAALIPKRPAHVAPWKILDGASGLDDIDGFYDFSYNPQEKNPERGYIISANHRPNAQKEGFMVPGYYNYTARMERLNKLMEQVPAHTQLDEQKLLQLDITSDRAQRALQVMLQNTRVIDDLLDQNLKAQLQNWDGQFLLNSVAASVFVEWQYQLIKAVFADELGEELFAVFEGSRSTDFAFYNVLNDLNSPWWLKQNEGNYADVLNASLQTALAVLTSELGADWQGWQWENLHIFEQVHPLGKVKPLNLIFNVGGKAVSGSHAVPNNLSQKLSSGMQMVNYGPSTRRLIDFSNARDSQGILPAGQSGQVFDAHYGDQYELYIQGGYRQQLMDWQVINRLPEHLILRADP